MREDLSMEGASDRESCSRWREGSGSGPGASWTLGNGRKRGVEWSVRGLKAGSDRGRERRVREALPARGARLLLKKRRRDVGTSSRSWRRVVKRGSTWGRVVARRSGALSGWLGAKASSASRRRSPRRKPRAQESSDLRVRVSNVGCRDRKEASSRRNQGEPRGEPRRRRVGRRGGPSRTRRTGARGPKGCWARRVNEQLSRTSSAEPQGEASIRRKASWVTLV